MEPLPDVNASQLQMLKYMKRGPSSNADSGSPASYGGKRIKKENVLVGFIQQVLGFSTNWGSGHRLTP